MSAALALVLLTASGCAISIGNGPDKVRDLGFFSSSRVRSPGGQVYVRRTLGLELAAASSEDGLRLGYGEAAFATRPGGEPVRTESVDLWRPSRPLTLQWTLRDQATGEIVGFRKFGLQSTSRPRPIPPLFFSRRMCGIGFTATPDSNWFLLGLGRDTATVIPQNVDGHQIAIDFDGSNPERTLAQIQ
ncbi:hypothetical protein GC173_07205 [bacterium]|nr:hypothetical protein [bacterium]